LGDRFLSVANAVLKNRAKSYLQGYGRAFREGGEFVGQVPRKSQSHQSHLLI